MFFVICLGLVVIIYLFLFYHLQETNPLRGMAFKNQALDRCIACHKLISSTWRYCPYCGSSRKER